MPYIGRPIGVAGHTTQKLDDPTGISSNAFTMKVATVAISPDAASLQIYVDGVRQEAGVAYTVSGSTITFTGTFTSSNDFQGYVMGDAMYIQTNSVDSDHYVDGSIDNAHLADDAVDSDELAAGSVDIAHLSASGTAGSGNFLRGDNSWTAVTSPAITSIAGTAANQILTDDGDATVTSESNLTYDGTTFGVDDAAVFNESGNDNDFRVEASGEANALFVQGSDGNVGIGTDSPATDLHIKNSSGHAYLSLDCDSGNGDLWQILSVTNGQLELYNADTDKWALMSTSEGAFSMGSNMQFQEVANATASSVANNAWTTAYTAGATEDGIWLVVMVSPDSSIFIIAWFSSRNGGASHEAYEVNGSSSNPRWDGDKLEFDQTSGTTITQDFVVYRLQTT